jgi:hypothetical protein
MANTSSSTPFEAAAPGYRVEAPRAGDAIGVALRDVFDRDLGLPDDMADLLRRLNGVRSDLRIH